MAKKSKEQPIPARPRYAGQATVERWRADGVDAVTAKDLAAALGVTPQGARSLAIPFTTVGKRDRRYSVDEIERYLIASTKAAS